MRILQGILCVAAALALAGCGTVRRAHDAQARLAPKGADAAAPRAAPRVDLAGAPLRALVDFAFANRPSMAAAALAVEDARLALREIAADAPIASATPWNAVDASANLGYSESSPQAKFKDLDRTHKGKASGAISVDLLLYDFGRNAARARAQAERVVAAELALAEEGYTVFEEVSAGYFAWLGNAALLEVACTNAFEYLEHLRKAEGRLSHGEAKEVDVLRARLDLAKARQDLVAASNDVATAGANLMAAMGVPAEAGDAAAVLGPAPAGISRVLQALPESTADAAETFAFARTNAPAMRIARAKLRAASADVDRAVADLAPSVSASVTLKWTDPLWYWSWGASAVQSLFSGFRRTTAVDRAVVALESAAADVDRGEQQLSHSVALAVAARDNAAEATRTAQASLREAQRNLALLKEQYELGDADRIEFTAAVAALTRAYGDRISAYYRGQAAEAQLLRLTGAEPDWPMESWSADE